MKTYALLLIVIALASCADYVDPSQVASIEAVGFWHGLWHVFIMPIAWIVSLFDQSVAIYATYNNGGWYDWGFIAGVSAAFRSSISYNKN